MLADMGADQGGASRLADVYVRSAPGGLRSSGPTSSGGPPSSGKATLDRDVAGYEAMRTALLSLPPRQRAAIVLRYYEDLHESDIPDLLRCRPATVRSLVARGLEALRRIPEVTT